MNNDNYQKYIKYKQKYLQLKNIQAGGKYSMIYVFNKLKNIIEKIPYDDFNEIIHVFIDDKQLESLAKKNHNKIKNIIKSQPNYKKKFYHVSISEFNFPFTDKTNNNNSWLGNDIYKNPFGIWLSCGISWQNYISDCPNKWSLATYIYEIKLNSDNIIFISNLTQLKNFINQYKKNNPKFSDIIDWKKVKKIYDGLVICPYLGNQIWVATSRLKLDIS
jgi:hypothetical protein